MTSLSEVLQRAVGGYRAPAATVAVQRDGEAVELGAVNAEPSQLFEVGSVTKTMTAVLVLQHVEQGQIQLDDPVVKYLPALGHWADGGASVVTIRQLLTHTSGLDCGDDFTDTGSADECLERYVDEALSDIGMLHPPGERWSYCNGGYSILGRLVEILDGRPWDDALVGRVFEPLGLSATTTARLRPEHDVAMGHRHDTSAAKMIEEPGRMPRSSGPAGNVVATAADLVSFSQALFSGTGQLLGTDLVAQMISPHMHIREGHQALAWLMPIPNLAVHGGATRGSTAFLAAIPGYGSLSVVANGPGGGAIAGAVQNHLFGSRESRVTGSGPNADVDPKLCVGQFARRHALIDLEWSEGRLIARSSFTGPAADLFPQPGPIELEPMGGGRFRSSRIHEDGITIWDFGDLDSSGIPMRVLSRRLANRVS